jgi:DNA polymerase elongation subunit (family B)
LAGEGELDSRVDFSSVAEAKEGIKAVGRSGEVVKPLEQQWLLRSGERLFGGMRFSELRRCQLDIEVATTPPYNFPDATRPGDRVLAIGLRFSHEESPRILRLEEESDAAELNLLKDLDVALQEADPDTIEGHNIFNFDLAYLRTRCRRYRVKMAWGREGELARFRSSRQRVAERQLDFLRCDIPGRTVVDTLMALQLWDVSKRDLPSYGLKVAAQYFGITTESDDRTYLPGDKIQDAFREDPEAFDRYLADDLRETAGLADRLLPTYVAQCQSFPILLQEALLRGTGAKVDLLMVEKYFRGEAALSIPGGVAPFAGGFSKSFGEGVFENVLHFDVASLYPSLLIQIGRDPVNDSLGAMIPLLKELRAYRLEYKEKARTATDPAVKAEFDARQNSFKILINSFYGYLGFAGARFADGDLAAEVTLRGRELLQGLIAWFEENGHSVLEADTDGLYVQAGDDFEAPKLLLAAAQATLPEGIELEFDGRYERMFCYKAKNYALREGDQIRVRGSALRSRATEPFLKDLTHHLISHLLGLEDEPVLTCWQRFAEQIEESSMPVVRLLKSEYLSMNPSAYAEKIAAGGKPRRASLEVALKIEPTPRSGDKVSYFIGPRSKGQTADWQRAHPLEHFDPVTCPYDPGAYLKKLKEWRKRYRSFVEQ